MHVLVGNRGCLGGCSSCAKGMSCLVDRIHIKQAQIGKVTRHGGIHKYLEMVDTIHALGGRSQVGNVIQDTRRSSRNAQGNQLSTTTVVVLLGGPTICGGGASSLIFLHHVFENMLKVQIAMTVNTRFLHDPSAEKHVLRAVINGEFDCIVQHWIDG